MKVTYLLSVLLCSVLMCACQETSITSTQDALPSVQSLPTDQPMEISRIEYPSTPWTFQRFLAVAETININVRQALVDSFITYWQQHVIPPVWVPWDSTFGTAAFLLRSTAGSAQVAGDFNNWDPSADPMSRLNGTTLFYRVKRFADNARTDYKFVTNGSTWILDPLNPRTMMGGFGPNSQMWMPRYVVPVEVAYNTGIPHGTIASFSIHSNIMNNTRTVSVYLPAGYDSTQHYPVLYCHDGTDYINLLKIRNVADWMIANQRVPAFIVVTVPWASPPGREGEYHMNANFASFFVTELIPHVDSLYSTVQTPAGRAIVGESSSGLGSVYLAFTHPETFRYAIGQSGYYSYNNDAMIHLIEQSSNRDVVFYLEVGTFENAVGGGENLYQAQVRLDAALNAQGYQHESFYIPDGHSWGNWQRTIRQAIEYIW